jgi:hypothetical protein
MNRLPNLVLWKIFDYLTPEDLCNLVLARWKALHVLRYGRDKSIVNKIVCHDLSLFKQFHKGKEPTIDLVVDGCNGIVVTWILNSGGCPWESDVFAKLVATGNLPLSKWFYSCANDVYDFYLTAKVMFEGLNTEIPEIMEWVLDIECPIVGWVHTQLVERGKIKALKFLYKHHVPDCSSGVLTKALIKNQLPIAQWLIDIKTPFCRDCCMITEFVDRGSLDHIKWLMNRGFVSSEQSVLRAIENDKEEILKWLINPDYGTPVQLSHRILQCAIYYGNMKYIKWLINRGCPMADCLYMEAMLKKNSTKIMDLLWESGCPKPNNPNFRYECLETTLSLKCMNINAARWFINHDFDCDIDTFKAAQKLGNQEILNLLIASKCPRPKKSYAEVVISGSKTWNDN